LVRGLMSDKEWAFFAPFVIATGSKSGRPPEDHRRVLDGVFWIARTGAPWRDLHDYFGKWSTVYRQFRRWTLAGVWELMLQALNESDSPPRSLQMIDSTIVRAHHQAAGAKGGLRDRVLAARRVASRPKSISVPTPKGSRSRQRSPAGKSRTTRAMTS
jgi:transposase